MRHGLGGRLAHGTFPIDTESPEYTIGTTMKRTFCTCVTLAALVTACGPAAPQAYYGGQRVGPAKEWHTMVVFRSTQPDRPHEDLGVVRVSCPSTVARTFGGGAEAIGGCSYDYAIYLAKLQVANSGADGLFGVEASNASNGNVVALTATAFRFTGAPSHAALAPSGPSTPPTVEERLRKLQKLRDDGLVTPEEFTRRKEEIIKEL